MRESTSDTEKMAQRIAAFKHKQKQAKLKRSDIAKFWENAVRVAVEFVSPVFIGICIGYLLDKWFDTRIIFMLILAIFGLAAGMLNVYRTAKQIEKDIDGSK